MIACKDDETDNHAGFASASQTVQEDDGSVEITINLDRAVGSATSLYFEYEGDALQNGDFKLNTETPLLIGANAKSVTIELEILDESVIESEEEIKFRLVDMGGSLVIPEDSKEFTLTIEDNDEAPDSGIQVDLTWASGSDMEDIDDFDLNLFIATNVEIVDDQVENFDIYSGSDNNSGFETAWIDGDAPDGEYYIIVVYESGDDDIPYTLNMNGDGLDNEAIEGDFEAADEGAGLFYGPITKDGSSFGRAKATAGRATWKVIKLSKSQILAAH